MDITFEVHEQVLASELWEQTQVVFIDSERFDGDVKDVDAGNIVGGR